MRLLLIHNPQSGGGDLPASEMVDRLRLVDPEAAHVSIKDDYGAALRDIGPDTVIVVAGGDGTLHKVARKLASSGGAIAVLPMGTANNIADCLGKRWDLESLVRLLPTAGRMPFDLGTVSIGGEAKIFMESVGAGAVATMMRRVDRDKDAGLLDKRDEMMHALEVMRDLARDGDTVQLRVSFDGGVMKKMDCIAFEVMNVASIGPRLRLVAERNPGADTFDVIVVRDDARRELIDHIESRMAGKLVRPAFETRRAKRVKVEWQDGDIHVDDTLVEINGSERRSLDIELLPQAITFVVPPGG